MKLTSQFALSVLLSIAQISIARAHTTGVVLLDTAHTGVFDTNNVPLPGVLVIVTNTSGTFSNAVVTSATGEFSIQVGAPTDTYVEFLASATLSAGATVELPAGGVFTFTLGPQNTNFVGNFLISTSSNVGFTNNIAVKAQGTILGTGKHAQFTFSGNAFPSCGSASGDTGEWDVTANALKLRFQGVIESIVNSGTQTDISGNTFLFVEFQGAGVLKGTAGCNQNFGLTSFFGRAEDHGHGCGQPDSLYFRVDASDGTTLLLISGDSANATDILPVSLSSGDIQVIANFCQSASTSGEGNGHHENGEGNQTGHGKGEGNQHGKGGKGEGQEQHGNSNGNGNCNSSQGKSEGHHGHGH